MTTNRPTGRDQLQGIAHAAMLQRGLLPDFSAAVLAEINQIAQAAAPSDAGIRRCAASTVKISVAYRCGIGLPP